MHQLELRFRQVVGRLGFGVRASTGVKVDRARHLWILPDRVDCLRPAGTGSAFGEVRRPAHGPPSVSAFANEAVFALYVLLAVSGACGAGYAAAWLV